MTDFAIAKAMLERNLSHGGFDVHVLANRSHSGVDMMCTLAPPAYMHVATGMAGLKVPAFTLRPESAQALLDALWEVGIRPSSGNTDKAPGESLVVAAMKDHLNDLRRLVFRPADEPDTSQRSPTIHHYPDPM